MLSIVIPTRNEARNIEACINCFKWAVAEGLIEVIVVDNFSNDGTADLAVVNGAKVVSCGPERSAQRNRGAIKESTGVYVFFVDADMRVKKETLEEISGMIGSDNAPDALFVREEIAGRGYWNEVRNFERSFYDGTCIDGLRIIRRALFVEVGGFDESLYAAEDWDLDRRIKAKTQKVSITKGALIHDEGAFSLFRHLKKKGYYSGNLYAYMKKWSHDAVVKKQFGLYYRMFGVFFGNGKWRRVLRRPDLMFCVWCYRVLIGFMFLMNKRA